jgi:hypothetical protein
MEKQHSSSWRQVAAIVGKVFGHPNSKCRVMVCDKHWNQMTHEMVYTVKFMFPHREAFKKDHVVLEQRDGKALKLMRELLDMIEQREMDEEIED